MLVNKLKLGKKIDVETSLKNYIIKHYDLTAYKSIETFISCLVSSRNYLITISQMETTVDSLKNMKSQIVEYLRNITSLKSRISFGTDNFSLKLQFSWKDILNNDYYSSYNINYEYYSNLFNLGVVYTYLGKSTAIDEDETKLKEGIKCLNYAAWVYDKIKAELPNLIPIKETPSDMKADYLSYVKFM